MVGGEPWERLRLGGDHETVSCHSLTMNTLHTKGKVTTST